MDNTRHPRIFQLMKDIAKYKTVTTSRPNAISASKEKEFDRKIESIGLDLGDAHKYIKKFFEK
jgi:hypothetical protein